MGTEGSRVFQTCSRHVRSEIAKLTQKGFNSRGKSNEEDLLNLMQVLKKSKRTLIDVELKVSRSSRIGEAVELLTAGSGLRSLVVWQWGSEMCRNRFPLARLVPSKIKDETSSFGQLQLLWVYEGVGKVDSKHLNSLVSFAQGSPSNPQKYRELISNFSKTIVHLRIGIWEPTSAIKPLFCPNLKIFEGWASGGLSSFLDAPQLQTLILEAVEDTDLADLAGFPTSVEEIWLRSRNGMLEDAEEWSPLLRLCPKLRILKLTEQFVLWKLRLGPFVFTGILEMLEIRNKMAQDGEEIDGIKMVSLEKLILPTSMLKEEELERAAEVAEEVIDIKDHPEFIEIQY